MGIFSSELIHYKKRWTYGYGGSSNIQLMYENIPIRLIRSANRTVNFMKFHLPHINTRKIVETQQKNANLRHISEIRFSMVNVIE